MSTTQTKPIVVARAVSRFIAEKKQEELSHVHVRTLSGRLNSLSRSFGDKPIIELSREHLLAHITSKGCKRTQVNHHSSIKLLLDWCRDSGHLPHDRKTAAEVLKIKAKTKEPEFYTPSDMRRLIKAASELPTEKHYALAFLVLGGFCGIRTAEILRMGWGAILFDAKIVKLSSAITKTARRRTVKIPPNALEWLLAAMPAKGCGLIVPNGNEATLRPTIAQVANAAGVRWLINGLRHSYGTYMMEKSHNSPEVSSQMGNSPAVLEKFYKGLALPSDADDYFGITPDNTL